MTKCLIWVRDFCVAKHFFNSFFKNQVLAELPFLNAFVVLTDFQKLEFAKKLNFVTKITSANNASVLLKKSRADLKIDDLHKQGILGQNTAVAIIDTGCHPHIDFLLGTNKIVCFKDFLNNKTFPYDDNGHGTFVAGIVGGSGIASGGKFKGIAPACKLVILKALNKNGETQGTNILKAMQWVLDNSKKFSIKVVCMSFGSDAKNEFDPLILGAEKLWKSGICVVCAAGNDGPEFGTIKSPGASPSVITVGSAQKLDNTKFAKPSNFSSRGPAFSFFKPDLIAPGEEIVSTTNSNRFYAKMSGTSVSTPFVAGLCALVLSKHSLTPNELKFLLQASATKTGFSPNETGSGLISPTNLEKLLIKQVVSTKN